MFACEKAVQLKPNDDFIQFTRGLARALTGDYQGAIDDLQVFLDSIKYQKKKAKVKGWIETLKKGDYQGAIDDLQVFLDSIKYQKEKSRVEGWIETLKKGENPFTSEVLEEFKFKEAEKLDSALEMDANNWAMLCWH